MSEEILRSFLQPATVGDDLDDLLYRRHSGTALWILEKQQFKDWYLTAKSHLWIKGKPGSGKSTLAATIIDRLQTDNRAIAYFFCRFSNDTKRTLASIMGTWLWQILEQMPELTEKALRRRTKGSGVRSQSSNINLALEEVLAAALTRVFLVLDGLDECETASKISTKVNDFVARIGNRHSSLIVSRDEVWTLPSRPLINNGYNNTEYIVIKLADSDTTPDIENWLRARVRDLNLLYDLETLALRKLTQKANGMFLWVEFQVKALEDQFIQEGARMVLEKDLPDGLNDTYERMLNLIL